MRRTPAQRIARAAAPLAGAVALAGFYLWVSSLAGGLMLRCPLKWLTGGLSCPGCGSQRALRLLMEGDIAGAAGMNLLIPLAMVYLGILWVCWVWDDKAPMRRLHERVTSPRVLWSIVGLVIGWWVVRNLIGI